ncbi:hypothetical protein J3E68DRAFT_428911 [Trichoderma sp. SZMC 28012]
MRPNSLEKTDEQYHDEDEAQSFLSNGKEDEPAISAIKLNRRQFYGNIVVNASNQFELMLNPSEERYVGHPTAELDAAWDRIVGK